MRHRTASVLSGIALLFGFAAGCGRPTVPDPGPPESAPPVQAATGGGGDAGPAAAVECASLSELACIGSAECTLVLEGEEGGGYRCRAAEGPCETGFRQKGDTRDDCEARDECVFVPGRCYCSPDVTCICGGGPPPQCQVSAG